MSIESAIMQANARLKQSGISLSIGKTGGKLWLRGILPPKPGNTAKSRQRIYLGIPADAMGVRLAESEAIAISVKTVLYLPLRLVGELSLHKARG